MTNIEGHSVTKSQFMLSVYICKGHKCHHLSQSAQLCTARQVNWSLVSSIVGIYCIFQHPCHCYSFFFISSLIFVCFCFSCCSTKYKLVVNINFIVRMCRMFTHLQDCSMNRGLSITVKGWFFVYFINSPSQPYNIQYLTEEENS